MNANGYQGMTIQSVPISKFLNIGSPSILKNWSETHRENKLKGPLNAMINLKGNL